MTGAGMAQHTDTSLSGPLVNLAPQVIVGDAALVTKIHEHHVPDLAIDALNRLYGSLYASYRHLQLCEADKAIPHTWLCYRRGEIAGVLLFRIESDRVLVLTEMFRLDAAVSSSFCQSVFARYPKSHAIVFNAVAIEPSEPSEWLESSLPPVSFPCQYFAFSENYVVDLPDSVDAYRNSLGKSTRKTLTGYGNRLRRDYPEFEWRAYSADELAMHEQTALVTQLQAFKRASMAARGKRAEIDAQDTARMLMMASESGLFSLGTVNGKLYAGSLACRVGGNYVMLLSAADPVMSEHRLGLLSCYWAICDCIQRSGRQCHLLWGRYQYKEQLLAKPQLLYQLKIYRSRWRMLNNLAAVTRMALTGWRYALRRWLLNELPTRQDVLSRWLLLVIDCLRQEKLSTHRQIVLRRMKSFFMGIFLGIYFRRS